MKANYFFRILLAAYLMFWLSSCNKDDDNTTTGQYASGVFISNEGPFTDGTGTVSFYDPNAKSIENDIFLSVNGRPLGNIVQSLEAFNGKIFVVVNNAGKVEVVEQGSFESTAVIDGLTLPRHFLGINNNTAYVSEWAGRLAIVDLNSMAKVGEVATGAHPDRMIKDGSRVWVVNSAGFSSDSTVTIVDATNNTPLSTIVVGDNPSGIVKDKFGKIWVICGGYSDWSNPANNTNGALVRINASTFSVEESVELNGTHFGAMLVINSAGDKLYFTFTDGIYQASITEQTATNITKVLPGFYYALGIDPVNSQLYVSDPLDYARPGMIYRYDPGTQIKVDSVSAGIIPGNFLFLYN